MTRVVLRASRDAGGSRHLTAELTRDGALVIEGQDLGPAVQEFFGCAEYEWSWTVAADHVGQLATALQAEPANLLTTLQAQFSDDSAPKLQQLLDSSGIPYERWSRHGD